MGVMTVPVAEIIIKAAKANGVDRDFELGFMVIFLFKSWVSWLGSRLGFEVSAICKAWRWLGSSSDRSLWIFYKGDFLPLHISILTI